MSSELEATALEAAHAGEAAISVRGVSKVYQIYDQPQHRLWQSLIRHRRFYREF